MNLNKKEIPSAWELAKLENFTDIIMGQSPPSSTYNNQKLGLPFYQGKAEFGDVYPTPTKWCISPVKIAIKGDILISVRAPVGPTNICFEKSCIGRGLAAIRGLGGIETLFVLHSIRTFENVIANQGTGSTFNAISGEKLREIEIPLAPLNEQRRIVAKIEALKARSQRVKEAIAQIPQLLDQFRQSVLAAAFRGDLTADWREQNPDVEPASVSLERIHNKRKIEYKNELEKARTEKKNKPKKPSYLDYTIQEHTQYSENIPEKWVVSLVGIICDCIVPGRDKPKSFTGFIPWVTLPDIISDEINTNSSQLYLNESEIEEVNARIIPAESVVMSCIGRFGISAITRTNVVINQQLHAFTKSELILPEYLMYHIKYLTDYMNNIATATTVSYLNKSNCNSLPINLPPLDEQKEIFRQIQYFFKVADIIQQQYQETKANLEQLDQSILAKAFRGELVPQDPNDEPASVLLERIRAERAKLETKTAKKSTLGSVTTLRQSSVTTKTSARRTKKI